ncbi:MAG: hypothetical protein OEQ39_23780 [Gammaproteobacteria bacterium]|nr:hypothetical protein [Gammaproteobacteria bacterium]
MTQENTTTQVNKKSRTRTSQDTVCLLRVVSADEIKTQADDSGKVFYTVVDGPSPLDPTKEIQKGDVERYIRTSEVLDDGTYRCGRLGKQMTRTAVETTTKKITML